MDTLSVIPKNKREEIRVGLDEYGGHKLFATRVFFEASGGDMRPGKSGISFRLNLLPRFAEGVAAALAEAKVRGLLK